MLSRRHFKKGVLACCALAGAACAAGAPTGGDQSPVGECSRHYRLPKPSEDYPVIVQLEKNADRHNNRYVWIWDPTPAKNPLRQLIRISPNKVGCTVLFMPNAEFHDFRLAPRGAIPAKVTATSATVNDGEGGYFFEQEYLLNEGTGYYQNAPHCYEVKTGSKQRKRVSCKLAIGG